MCATLKACVGTQCGVIEGLAHRASLVCIAWVVVGAPTAIYCDGIIAVVLALHRATLCIEASAERGLALRVTGALIVRAAVKVTRHIATATVDVGELSAAIVDIDGATLCVVVLAEFRLSLGDADTQVGVGLTHITISAAPTINLSGVATTVHGVEVATLSASLCTEDGCSLSLTFGDAASCHAGLSVATWAAFGDVTYLAAAIHHAHQSSTGDLSVTTQILIALWFAQGGHVCEVGRGIA